MLCFQAQAKASPKRPITEVDNEKLKALNNELHSSKEALTKIQDEMKLARQKYEDVQGYDTYSDNHGCLINIYLES